MWKYTISVIYYFLDLNDPPGWRGRMFGVWILRSIPSVRRAFNSVNWKVFSLEPTSKAAYGWAILFRGIQWHQGRKERLFVRENGIQREIKEIYCDNLQLIRYTTQLLAESNGLIAARADNLPLCHRLKPNGVHLIVQKCKELNITVTGAKTKCGYEPKYLDFTIGRDGFSLHPFQECCWKDELVNLNGRSYTWTTVTPHYIGRQWMEMPD